MDEYFKEFIEKLNTNRAEYLVIGGYAVIRHGYVRATGDMDGWVNPTEENAERVIRALVQFGYSPYDFEISDFTHRDSSVSLGNAPFKIDILSNTLGVTFEESYARRTDTVIDGVTIPFLSYQDLITNKKAVGRPKDLLDLDNLPELGEP